MICTYYGQDELDKMLSVSDKDLNELYAEIRKVFEGKYYLKEKTFIVKSLFRKTVERKVYTLLYQAAPNDMEVQVINFCQDHDWSINTKVTKSYITTYFLGLLNGIGKMPQPNTHK